MKKYLLTGILAFLSSCGLANNPYKIVSMEDSKISKYLPDFPTPSKSNCYWETEFQYSIKYCRGQEMARCSDNGCYYRTKEVVDIQNDRIMQLRESDIDTEYRLMRKRQLREIRENSIASGGPIKQGQGA